MSGILSYIGQKMIEGTPRSTSNDNRLLKTTSLNLDFYKNGFDTHYPPTESEHIKRNRTGRFSIIVKGEINNQNTLINCLSENYGFAFKSNSKAEILAYLIEWFVEYSLIDIKEALARIFNQIEGNISIVMYDQNTPNQLYAVRRGCPLFIGLAQNKAYVASKQEKLSTYTHNTLSLEDNSLAIIRDIGKITVQQLKR